MADNTPPGGDDYDNWTWKQIETAVIGGVDMSIEKQTALQTETSYPESFTGAGDTYDDTRQTLQDVRDKISKWSDQNVGVEGHWKGKAANAFKAMIDKLLEKIDGMIAAIVGPQSYKDSLADSREALRTAIQEILDADHEAAQKTIDRYNDDVEIYQSNPNAIYIPDPPWRYEGGTQIVAVSTYPDIVEEMTKKMRESIKKLAAAYKDTIGDLRDPQDPALPKSNGAPDDPAPIDPDAPPTDGNTPPDPEAPPAPDTGPPAPEQSPNQEPPQTPPNQSALVLPGTQSAPMPMNLLVQPDGQPAPDAPFRENLFVQPDGRPAPDAPLRENLFIGQPAPDAPQTQPPTPMPHLVYPGGTPLTTPSNLVYDPTTHLAGTGNMAFSGFAPGISSPDGGHFLVSNGNELPLNRPALVTPGTSGTGLYSGLMSPMYGGGRSYALRSGTQPPPTMPPEGIPPRLNSFTAPNTPIQPNFITSSTGPASVPTADVDGGAPLVPGMIGRRGSEEQEHDTASWLVEQDDAWDDGLPSSPSFLSRSER